MKFIIEHLDKEVFEWCLLEYKHIKDIVGRENLIFTNIKRDKEKLYGLGEIREESVTDLKLQTNRLCVLDPASDTTLTTKDKEIFDYFIFGGVLGDYPMQFRTKSEISQKLKCETRNLGKEQMSTDTAVLVTKTILDGKKLKDIEFKDEIEIEVEDGESVVLPFRYVVENGEIVLAKGLKGYIKENPGF